MNKKIFRILFYLVSFLNAYLIITYLKYPIIDNDSGFYMAVARDLYAGNIYFHEIGVVYNPLSIITFGIPFLFDNAPAYSCHLAINILIVICSSFVFYRILTKITSIKINNLFYSSFFVLLSLTLDGKFMMLEPLSVFFQLLAFLFYLKFITNSSKIIFVGLFISLSFLSKQYGLFIALPIGLDLLIRIINKKAKIHNVLFIALGFSLPLVFFYSYLSYYDMPLFEFVKHILGKGTKLDQGNGTAIFTSFFLYPIDLLYILMFNIYVLLIPILLFKNFRKLNSMKYLFTFSALSSLSLLYFANYWHYYQYIITFWILLFVYLSQNGNYIHKKYIRIVPLVFCFSVVTLIYYSITPFTEKQTYIEHQLDGKKIILSNIPEKSEVYLDGPSQAFYYLCKFKSINLKNVGYTFPGYLFPKTIIANLKPGAYLVVSKESYNLYKKFTENYLIKNIVLDNKEYIILKKP